MASTNRPKRENIMLAYPAEPKRIARLGEKFFAQPKLNGERFRVEWFHNEPVILSSYGNEFQYLDHLKEQFKSSPLAERAIPFDGEIYVHGWPREKIDSCLRRRVNYNPDVIHLEAHIFDYQDMSQAQWYRFKVLQEWNDAGFFSSHLKLVPFVVIQDDDWLQVTAEYIKEGYEGAIFRYPLAGYSFKRTASMLKYKPTEKDEYTIVGTQEGTGWAEGMLGAFIVQGDDGTQFNVGSGKLLTKAFRAYLWSIRHQLPGKILIVKHEATETSGGIPLCTTALEIKGMDI